MNKIKTLATLLVRPTAVVAATDLAEASVLVQAVRKVMPDAVSVTRSGAKPKYSAYAYEVIQGTDVHDAKGLATKLSKQLRGGTPERATEAGVFRFAVGDYEVTVRARPLVANEGEANYVVSVQELPN